MNSTSSVWGWNNPTTVGGSCLASECCETSFHTRESSTSTVRLMCLVFLYAPYFSYAILLECKVLATICRPSVALLETKRKRLEEWCKNPSEIIVSELLAQWTLLQSFCYPFFFYYYDATTCKCSLVAWQFNVIGRTEDGLLDFVGFCLVTAVFELM